MKGEVTMALGKLAPILTITLLSILSIGCTTANGYVAKPDAQGDLRCRIPSLVYDVPGNPFPSRFVMTKKAFNDAKSKSEEGDGFGSFAIAQHILGQLNADTDAAECWFKMSSQQGHEPARLQLLILNLSEARRNCSQAKKYSDHFALGPATLGGGWLDVLNSCRALLGEPL